MTQPAEGQRNDHKQGLADRLNHPFFIVGYLGLFINLPFNFSFLRKNYKNCEIESFFIHCL
ncbi:hypothetical protein A8F95_19285 [Bacillus wudalianchiensis]|uniref:Uncharacterized protein n=1 Tax=Pseudobacillus wudalianchiensis TaxID=1743143 RepID=A0A1B9B757_9BACI|nr:hypothetical protein A8F95_19285 [Bacillus wudalianchiensis]